jgi:mRNA interferase RelE/StbE
LGRREPTWRRVAGEMRGSPGCAARRQLACLPEAVATAVLNFLDGPLAENPHLVGQPLLKPLDGLHSARRGTYRILYRIEDRLVLVIKVSHRKGAYRP